MAKIIKTKPITIKEANIFINKYHRHHRPTTKNCGKWAISVVNKLNNELVGVAICANPVSATYMDGVCIQQKVDTKLNS